MSLSEMNACRYLFLESIGEPETNSICLVFTEGIVGEPEKEGAYASEENEELRKILASSRPILHTSGCKIFELHWDTYIAYGVRNESYACDGPEDATRERVGVCTQSTYLSYLKQATFADSNYPGPFQHWSFICSDHFVEVVSTTEPRITVHLAQ